jgi:tetrahydromethanopterin S-methyltransferase subunit G
MEGIAMPAGDDNNDLDLRARVVALEHSDQAVITRLGVIEQWQMQSLIKEGSTGEKWKNVDKRFDDLDKKIEKVFGILLKIMWLFVSGFVLAFVALIVNGGLKVP